MASIVTTVSLILKELQTKIVLIDSTLKISYDPQLTFETGMRSLRANSNFNKELTNQGEHPLLLFNRSAIRLTDNRFEDTYVAIDNTNESVGTSTTHKVAFGEFDYRFLYVSPDMSKAEAFEINYITESGIRSINSITPDLSSLGVTGDIKYQIIWNPLEDLLVESEGNYYKAISGLAIIRGWFVTIEGTGKIIKTIYMDLFNWYSAVLRNFIIT